MDLQILASARFFLWILAAVLFSPSLAPSTAWTAEKITVGTVFKGPHQWPLFVAEEKGFFKERGVIIDHIVTRSAQNSVQQLAAASLHVAESGFPPIMRAIEKGAPAKIFMNDVGTPPYRVFGQKGLKSARDLKGKKIIIGGAKDVTRIYTEALLNAHGLKYGDYDYIYAGSTPARFAALVSGGADAAILLPPFDLKAEGEGYANLGNIQTYLKDFPFTVYAVNTDWAAKNRAALVDFTAAYLQAVRWLYNKENKAAAVDMVVANTKTAREDGVKIYDLFFKELEAFSKTGELSAEAYKKMINALVEWGDVQKPIPPMEKFFDASFVKAAGQG